MRNGIVFSIVAGAAITATAWAQSGEYPPLLETTHLYGGYGFRLDGPAESYAGRWLAPAGDLNGDGIDDMAIGAFRAAAPATSGVRFGVGAVVYGRADGAFPDLSRLEELDGEDGFLIHYSSRVDRFARSIGTVGDFNGDGVDDLVVTTGEFPTDGGESIAYVLFGRQGGGFPAMLDLASVGADDGVFLDAADLAESSLVTAAAAGDMNGDGVGDVLLGVPESTTGGLLGECFVVFGASDGLPSRIDLRALDGEDGFAVRGMAELDFIGYDVAAAGDVNNDGVGDVILGAPESRPTGRSGPGRAYVVFGREGGGFGPRVELADLDGTNGFTLDWEGSAPVALGDSVAGLGDVNGDGIDDCIAGAPNMFGLALVVYGREDFPAVFDQDDIEAGAGVLLEGPTSAAGFGSSVASAGDLNLDGVNDIIVGRPTVDLGSTYVFFGGDLPPRMSATELDGGNGFGMLGEEDEDDFGYASAGIGDINADGRDDIAVSAWQYQGDAPTRQNGRIYVHFGGGYCRVDLVADGRLDVFDFLAFQNAFYAGERIADMNTDGVLDIFDFLAFQNAFEAGCH